MSDDDDIIYIKKHKSIHYGSLEEQERARLAAAAAAAIAGEDSNGSGGPTIASEHGPQVHISNGKILATTL